MDYIRVNQLGLVPVERTFACRHCGLEVNVVDRKDKRFVYCSARCEKNYWRDMSKKSLAIKKRGREYSTMRSYTHGNFIRKLGIEKKESEEVQKMIGKI